MTEKWADKEVSWFLIHLCLSLEREKQRRKREEWKRYKEKMRKNE